MYVGVEESPTIPVSVPVHWGPTVMDGNDLDDFIGHIDPMICGSDVTLLFRYLDDVGTELVVSDPLTVEIKQDDTLETLEFTFNRSDLNNALNSGYVAMCQIVDNTGETPFEGIVNNWELDQYNDHYECTEIVDLLFIGAAVDDGNGSELELCYCSTTTRQNAGRSVSIDWEIYDGTPGIGKQPILSGTHDGSTGVSDPWIVPSSTKNTVCAMIQTIPGLPSYIECEDMGISDPYLQITAHFSGTSVTTTRQATDNTFYWHVEI